MGVNEVADLWVKLSLVSDGFHAGLEKAKTDSDSFSGKMQNVAAGVGKLALGFAAAGIGVAGVSVKMAGDWQASMIRLVTSAGETGAVVNGKLTGPIANVSKSLLQMAVDTGTSTKELATGMYYVESAGFHGADGLQVMKMAAQGAKAEGADLKTVADALTTALHDMGAGADQSTAYMDMMIKTVASGKTNMESLAGSLHSVLPQAASAHISFQDIGAAIATMTVAGTSADQATQMLGHTIGTLQGPNALAVKWMSQMGLSATDLGAHLGDRGLLGTFNLIDQAILTHMGPDGLSLQSSFNKSKSAAQDLGIMLASMPPQLSSISQELQKGSITATDYTKATKAMPANLQAQGAEFLTLFKNSSSFNLALRAGTPDALTFAATLKKVTGDSVTMNTIMQAGGANLATFAANEAYVGTAAHEASGNIETWGTITQGFNFKMDQMRQLVETTAIKIGTAMLPKLTELSSYLMTTVVPMIGKFGTELIKAFESPAAKAAGAAIMTVFKDLMSFVGQAITSVKNFGLALEPTASLLAKLFLGSLMAIGRVLKDDIGPAFVAFSGFLRDNATLVRDVAIAALAALGAKLLYVATLASIDMFANLMNGISAAAVGIQKFITAIGSGSFLDTLRLKAMYAGDAMKGVATSETMAADAGLKAAGEQGMGGFLGTIGRAVPILGGVAIGIGLLSTQLGSLKDHLDFTKLSATQLNTQMLGLSTQSPQTQQAMGAFGLKLAEANQYVGAGSTQLKNYDQSMAELVSSGHAADAKVIIDQIAAATDAQGKKIVDTTREFPQYYAAVDQQTNMLKQQKLATDGSTGALNTNKTATDNATAANKLLNASTQTVDTSVSNFESKLQAETALGQFNSALLQVTQSAKDNGAAIDANSQAGLANQTALQGAAQQILNYYQQQTAATGPTAQATKDMNDQITTLYNQADKAFPASKGAVDAYLQSLGLIKPSYTTTIHADTSQAMAALANLAARMNQIASVGSSGTGVGHVGIYDKGGLVPGAKGEPQVAIIHGGEYVVTADEMAGISPNQGGAKLAIGGGGDSGGGITIIVQGSILAERDLSYLVQRLDLQRGGRNSMTYPAYKR